MTPGSTITIQDAIDTILTATAAAPISDTVDTVKSGDPTRPLTGIVTTFITTVAVIGRTAELGANLIITHEPTYYTHLDETEWLRGDVVYEAKRQLVDTHGIVVWRFHDYWHRTRPDGILTGVIQRLGWESEEPVAYPHVVNVPKMTLSELTGQLKERLVDNQATWLGMGQQ